MPKVLWGGNDTVLKSFETPLKEALINAVPNAELVFGFENPSEIDYLIYAPNGPIQNFDGFTALKLIQSIWAGVDVILSNGNLPNVPLSRMADTGMAEGMADYVVTHVMRHHCGTDTHVQMKPTEWLTDTAPPLARDRKVAVLGLGNLGQFCAARLRAQGFQMLGWSRSPKTVDGVTVFHGKDGLKKILSEGDIFVLLLPNTPDTENTLNAETIAKMKPGASLVNAGRGDAIDDGALVSALRSGHISQATLDVFRTEPLPSDHPYWHMPNVLVTPHIAAETRVKTACEFAAENIRRGENGEPFMALVDRHRGY
ncbi:MAG: glyoxylate/hydroxypyruvate reductase A [Pseudomonadota bacterium]